MLGGKGSENRPSFTPLPIIACELATIVGLVNDARKMLEC